MSRGDFHPHRHMIERMGAKGMLLEKSQLGSASNSLWARHGVGIEVGSVCGGYAAEAQINSSGCGQVDELGGRQKFGRLGERRPAGASAVQIGFPCPAASVHEALL
eukprot:6470926-Amphidinium_carterae.1